MTFPWQALVDLATLGFLIYLFVVSKMTERLLRQQVGFLVQRLGVLEKTLEALQGEAATLKAHTDRFLAILAELSPDKFLQGVKVIEELLEKHAQAKIADVEREAKDREQEAKELAKDLFGKLGSTTAVLALALYELPRDQRSILLTRVRDEAQREIVAELVTEIERAYGPSPADQSSAFGALLARALGPGPPEANPFSRLRPRVAPRPTDATPGTPAEPGGETRTSP